MLIWMLLLGFLALGKAQELYSRGDARSSPTLVNGKLDGRRSKRSLVDLFREESERAIAGPCGGNIRDRSGFISSPRYPQNYYDNTRCTWNIIAPPQHKIVFEFVDLQFPKPFYATSVPFTCHEDYVQILSILSDRTEKSHGTFCLSRHKYPITSEENLLKIKFISNSIGRDRGFKASFRVIENPTSTAKEPQEVSTTATPVVMPVVLTRTTPVYFSTAAPKSRESYSESELKSRFESSKYRNIQWLLNRMKRRKAFEMPRGILALYLTEPEFFAPGNQTGAELRDKLTIHILAHISKNATIRSQDLALYAQALLVTCQDPRDFFGRDLVKELRTRVDQPSGYANPFEILALCNIGDKVSPKDVERVSGAFDSQHRPFWIDVQAIATMTMQCLSTKVTVDERVVKDMQDELKKRQFRNGTVENLVTTALVVQALGHNGSAVEFFDLPSALEVLLRAQGEDGSWGGSVRNSAYVLPAISGKSFLNISTQHCPRNTESEEESLARLQESGGDKWVVQYSVWVGSDVDLGRTWRVRVQANKNSSFYDLIEMVSKLDNRHNVSYQVVDGKPYVRSLLGKEDDPELGIFWFTYLRSTSTKQPPTLIESSPVDVLLNPNQEFIMWYKPNTWREDSAKDVS